MSKKDSKNIFEITFDSNILTLQLYSKLNMFHNGTNTNTDIIIIMLFRYDPITKEVFKTSDNLVWWLPQLKCKKTNTGLLFVITTHIVYDRSSLTFCI